MNARRRPRPEIRSRDLAQWHTVRHHGRGLVVVNPQNAAAFPLKSQGPSAGTAVAPSVTMLALRSRSSLNHWLLLLAAAMSGSISCGGNVDHDPAPGASASAGVGARYSGGEGGNGPSTGGKPTGGNGPTTGGTAAGGALPTGGSPDPGTGCCLAFPICKDGDVTLENLEQCPAGTDCYEMSICCSTIACAHLAPECNALPSCDAGDVEIIGACPPDLSCYARTLCGITRYCISKNVQVEGPDGKTCDPANEPNRHYVSTEARQCQLIDYACPEQTKMFGNDCGCGCEQAGTCPSFVDCAPRPLPSPSDPLCGDRDSCPYTVRAL
jgi:hypothetical protein